MYIFNRIIHTNSEVVSVYIKLDIQQNLRLKVLQTCRILKFNGELKDESK